MSAPKVQLSCQQCRNRKTKCDKQVPCSACLKADIECTTVQRHRLPRGRSGNHAKYGNTSLRSRINHLESIVSQLQQSQAQSGSNTIHGTSRSQPDAPVTTLDSYLAPDFWKEITDAVADIKHIVESSSEDDVADDVTSHDVASGNDVYLHTLLSGVEHTIPQVDLDSVLDGSMKERLLVTYEQRIDPIFKVLHWPSTCTKLRSLGLDNEVRALAAAVYFTATCSLFDHEIENRTELIEQLRHLAEESLAAANVLTTRSLCVLQAFLIYLAGIRVCRANAQQWTLVATAIRIASAQGISNEQLSQRPPSFDTEIRCRVWLCIGVLDTQAAHDRGSQPLISRPDARNMPLNVNDRSLRTEMLINCREGVEEVGWTDMTYSQMIYRAGMCQSRLFAIGSASGTQSGLDPLAVRCNQLQTLEDFKQHIGHLSSICSEPSTAIQRFTIAVAEESLVALQLQVYRPLYKTSFKKSGDNGFDTLGTATEVLQRSQMKRSHSDFAQWAWQGWVKWYALAVVLAELCVASDPVAEHAWQAAKVSFADYATAVADTQTGLLWKPIAKLMRKVRALKGETEDESTLQMSEELSSFKDEPTKGMLQAFSRNDVTPNQEATLSSDEMEIDAMSWFHWDAFVNDIDFSDIQDY